MASSETAMVPLSVPDVKTAVEVMKQFQQLKHDLLDDNDVVQREKRTYVKRSGWRKIELAFNISVGILTVERETRDDGTTVVHVRAQAKAPNGRYAEDVGACETSEILKSNMDPTMHNIETRAATRAINRAISDLVGGGEISAEEVGDDEPASHGEFLPPKPKEEGMPKELESSQLVKELSRRYSAHVNNNYLVIYEDDTYVYLKRTRFLKDADWGKITADLAEYNPIADGNDTLKVPLT